MLCPGPQIEDLCSVPVQLMHALERGRSFAKVPVASDRCRARVRDVRIAFIQFLIMLWDSIKGQFEPAKILHCRKSITSLR